MVVTAFQSRITRLRANERITSHSRSTFIRRIQTATRIYLHRLSMKMTYNRRVFIKLNRIRHIILDFSASGTNWLFDPDFRCNKASRFYEIPSKAPQKFHSRYYLYFRSWRIINLTWNNVHTLFIFIRNIIALILRWPGQNSFRSDSAPFTLLYQFPSRSRLESYPVSFHVAVGEH